MSRLILAKLNDAETALRENLHRHDLDPVARAHMERAVSHVREAYIGTNEIGKARTVQELACDLDMFDRLLKKVRHQESPGVVTLKLSA